MIAFYIYRLFCFVLRPMFFAIVFLVPKARKIYLKRTRYIQEFLSLPIPESKAVRFWLHGASVGELDQSRSFAKQIKKHIPESFILQSVFSESVSESFRKDSVFDFGIYLPFDFPNSYKPILEKLRPNFVIIFSWDTWPNFAFESHSFGAKLVLACASLSPQSGRDKGLARYLTKDTFSFFDFIFPSHPLLVPRFQTLLPPSKPCEALGDTRFDSVLEKLENQSPPESFLQFLKIYPTNWLAEKPILFGSTYEPCEELILQFVKSQPQALLWVFPHHWEEERVKRLESSLLSLGTPASRFSEILERKKKPTSVVLFDKMGILAFAYAYARLAYVGGALHNRVHNTIEPAALGLYLLTGTRIQSASEALVMREAGGLFSGNQSELKDELVSRYQDFAFLQEKGEKNRNFVLENRGASLRLFRRIWNS